MIPVVAGRGILQRWRSHNRQLGGTIRNDKSALGDDNNMETCLLFYLSMATTRWPISLHWFWTDETGRQQWASQLAARGGYQFGARQMIGSLENLWHFCETELGIVWRKVAGNINRWQALGNAFPVSENWTCRYRCWPDLNRITHSVVWQTNGIDLFEHLLEEEFADGSRKTERSTVIVAHPRMAEVRVAFPSTPSICRILPIIAHYDEDP